MHVKGKPGERAQLADEARSQVHAGHERSILNIEVQEIHPRRFQFLDGTLEMLQRGRGQGGG
jgi:hypothetical protein